MGKGAFWKAESCLGNNDSSPLPSVELHGVGAQTKSKHTHWPLHPAARSGCSRKECPAIHHEKVFKLWGVSPGPATPPCPGPGDLTLPEPLSPCLAVVRLQHGSPALTLPCALSHSCWATLLGAAASTELSPSLQARVTGCPPILPPPPGAGSPLLCHSPGGGWLALGVSRQAGSRERWRR